MPACLLTVKVQSCAGVAVMLDQCSVKGFERWVVL